MTSLRFQSPSVAALAAAHMDFALRRVLKVGPSVMQTDRYLLILTGAAHPLGNGLLGIDACDIEGLQEGLKRLSETEAPAALLFATPVEDPSMLAEISDAGFHHHMTLPAMACEIDKVATTSLPAGYELVEVGEEHAESWVQCLAEGYGLPLEVAELFPPCVSDEIRFFGVLHDGRIVSTSLVVMTEGVAGIYAVATLEEERKKGLGAHVTAEAVRFAGKAGYEVGVLQATDMGQPVYERLGFHHCSDLHMYIRMPEQPE
jgi:GNAT superfamily N-acetyltransferase